MSGWVSRVRRLIGWPLVVALAVIAFVLGFFGFKTSLGADRSGFDIAYLSLQLFTVESGSAAGPSPPITLEIARFLAPATTAYALASAMAQIFKHQLERWRLRSRSGHVVVVGLGWLGLELVERLQGSNDVVAVSLQMDDEAIASVRRSRVPVVVGDASDPDVLREARADKASHIVVLAGDDEINAEVALTARSLFEESDHQVVCLAHIRDPQLCQMLRTEALTDRSAGRFRLEFFNVAEEAAAIMLDEHAGFLTDRDSASIGIIGGNDVAGAVISEAARLRRLHGLPSVRITISAPGDLLERLYSRFPLLRSAAEFEEIPASGPLERLAECDLVFVCDDRDTRAIATTLDLAGRLGQTPVVVPLGQWAGMATMLENDAATKRAVHPFLIPTRLLEGDLLLAGLGERLAREIHGSFLSKQQADGTLDPSKPSHAAWRDLAERFRDSNRAQAADIGPKLHAIGCGMAPIADWDMPPAALTAEEIETMAILEHERFVEERLAAGWKQKEDPDPDEKESPYLIPWDDLEETIKDYDRDAVRNIPDLLARTGYQIVRPGPG